MCLSRTVEVVPVVVDDDFFPFVVPPKVCRPFALTTKRNTRVVRAEEREEEEEEEEEAPEEKRRRARFDTEEELLRGETTFACACCAVPVVGATGGVTPMVSKANKKNGATLSKRIDLKLSFTFYLHTQDYLLLSHSVVDTRAVVDIRL